MTVTKQQQLEFAVMHIEKWKSGYDFAVIEETNDGQLCVRWPSICSAGVSKKEWQQERERIAEMNAMTMQMCNIKPLELDKMSSRPEVDNSWHERGELPPQETYCQFKKANEERGWVNCFVIGIDDLGFCVCRVDMDYFASMSSSDFRPLRTERGKAIDEMVYEFINHYGDPKGGERYLPIAAKLYDAGYRKVKP